MIWESLSTTALSTVATLGARFRCAASRPALVLGGNILDRVGPDIGQLGANGPLEGHAVCSPHRGGCIFGKPPSCKALPFSQAMQVFRFTGLPVSDCN